MGNSPPSYNISYPSPSCLIHPHTHLHTHHGYKTHLIPIPIRISGPQWVPIPIPIMEADGDDHLLNFCATHDACMFSPCHPGPAARSCQEETATRETGKEEEEEEAMMKRRAAGSYLRPCMSGGHWRAGKPLRAGESCTDARGLQLLA
jgi:hypothetical protein